MIFKLNAEILRGILSYDPLTGIFTRSGEVAGWIEPHGYRKISVLRQKHYAHRLAWLYMTGEWPKNKIDHVDGDRLNNSFANLREATDLVNAQNLKRAQINNKVGLLGVYKKRKRFVARIYAAGKQIVIGTFACAEEAHSAYVEAKRRLHEGCTI